MKPSSLITILLGFIICHPTQGQAPARKIALIIGVKSYQFVPPLQNSLNDAVDIASTLKSKQFDVIELYDPKTKREMQDAVRKYFAILNGQKDMAGLIFYSGHGMQVDGTNYLIPANANPQLKADLDDECLSMDYVMRAIEEAGNPLNIFILDACRNNPFRSFSRSGEKGLSIVNSPKGSYMVYATKPGSVASDGTGRNGLFTSKLLKYIDTPELNIEQVFKRVAAEVAADSKDAQRPWIASDYTGDFFFNSSGPSSPPNNLHGQQAQEITSNTQSQGMAKSTEHYSVGGIYSIEGTNPNGTRYIGTCQITKRPDGDYDYTWTTGGTVSQGLGKLYNGIMTVNYGDTYPAIYQVQNEGSRLDGTWGNSTGKEILILAQEPSSRSGSPQTTYTIGGTYTIDGTNPNGTRYIGTCQITKRLDGDYDYTWTTGGSVSKGLGKLNNDIMTVNYGDTYPAIYKVLDNGKKLDGTWANGAGKEVLTR
jgi:Caspase domain